ncbi:MAG: Tetratricopeptide (TPR) repeat [Chloroflexi bacterium AL-W]|nr:Tetratricopeptide (TPR) repeat [Chloroflexi bacterium AL-N1]NOK67983.1 Tetratricopeptide (TPR) repeat [Chloroflexi bacterium AL-N10]NOK73323.1 Tetratricopeptide (TPR) repeat [Chloroflexi bacterium AL-N5]NOK83237.1 Tetratricopeptide (TPR) repeat [Chloroflexi bacterium AL-W]NOK87654.1 Tetratricopeptide (TPR) repeat [Chloroflexi bacterium AL-N15]
MNHVRNLGTLPDLTPMQQHVLITGMLLKEFDDPLLEAILHQTVTAEFDMLLEQHMIEATAQGYQIVPTVVESIARLPAGQHRHAAEKIVEYFAYRISQGTLPERAASEHTYIYHLEHLCEMVIRREPRALSDIISMVPVNHLSEPQHQYLVAYYQGLGEGLADRLSSAQQHFAELLAESHLAPALRARTLNSSAFFAHNQGQYEVALAYYTESLTLWRELGNILRQGMALLNMGSLHHQLHAFVTAKTCIGESIELFTQTKADFYQATALNTLGVIERDQGKWDAAIACFEKAYTYFQSVGSSDYAGRVLHNMAELELLRGSLQLAQEQFQHSLELMTTQIHAVDTFIGLGLLCQAQSEQQAALTHYREALQLAYTLERYDILGLIHARIGHTLWQLADYATARSSYAQAIAAIEANRQPLRDEGLLVSLMGRWQQIYEAAILFCLERGDIVTAFNYAERARARAFADLLVQRDSTLADSQAVPLTSEEVRHQLSSETVLLAYFTTGLHGPETALLNAMPSEAAAVRACLETPSQLLLFALTSASIDAHICNLDPHLLHSDSPYLADGKRFLRPPILRRAYDALIGPVADRLEPTTHVIVVPHGPLHQLSFAALLDPAGGCLLDQIAHVSYAPSATVLFQSMKSASSPPACSCLAFGFDGVGDRQLRHTEAEATQVAQVCHGDVVHRVTELQQQFIDVASAYRYIHFACHGEFNMDEPLNSWLEPGPDTRITATRIMTDAQLCAELVVLNACRSGVSHIVRGDEPMGFIRAFMLAGARVVLVTLWPVEDTSARLLMERFYQLLMAQEGDHNIAAALCEAQGYLRELTIAEIRAQIHHWEETIEITGNPHEQPYAAPVFWAPYVVVGVASHGSIST